MQCSINVFSTLSPLAVFWYQILLSPVDSCIHFQVWFYFTWLHLLYTKYNFAWVTDENILESKLQRCLETYCQWCLHHLAFSNLAYLSFLVYMSIEKIVWFLSILEHNAYTLQYNAVKLWIYVWMTDLETFILYLTTSYVWES